MEGKANWKGEYVCEFAGDKEEFDERARWKRKKRKIEKREREKVGRPISHSAES